MSTTPPYTGRMPSRVDLSDFACSVARTLDVVGDKWTLLILRDAFYGVRRFDDFARDLGIARNVLTSRLTGLVAHGVLERRRYEARPPRHEYVLTEKGRALFPVVMTMMHWGDRWQPEDGEIPVTVVHERCGEATHAVTVCAHCAEPIGPRDVRVEPLPPVVEELRAARRAAEPA